MRTLVVSDLHLGSRLRHDVLRLPAALDALLAAVSEADRLVLLGDLVELAEGRPREALAVAEPVIRALGSCLGPSGEAIVVPGNHDARLVRPWVRATGRELEIDASVPPSATPALELLTSWLAPAHVRVHYPGVWLTPRVWATHGHYLDRHLLPESVFGIARGLLGRLPRDGAVPFDYEATGGPSLTRLEAALTRWLPRPVAALFDDVVEVARALTMPGIENRRLGRPTAWLASTVLGAQMRRASMPALARVVHRLGVDADWVLFGHVHRCGPLEGESRAAWSGPGGRPQMANSGSWVYEPLLVHRAAPPHPYWPGGALVLDDDSEPRAIGLLDHLAEAQLNLASTVRAITR